MNTDSAMFYNGVKNNTQKSGRKIRKVPRLVLLSVILVLLACLVVLSLLLLNSDRLTKFIPADDGSEPTPYTDEAEFRFASVASSTKICSQVGTDVLAVQGGSAVDAAIASLLCVGLVRFHSSGLGGDSFWTIYDRKEGKAYTIMARSTAPLNTSSHMFLNNSQALIEGGLSVAVPGEVLAMWQAHQRFGRLPWGQLFQPSIRLALEGFPLEASTATAIQSKLKDGTLDRFPQLREMLTNPSTGTWYKAGEIIRNRKLADSLTVIATNGSAVFYNGSLAEDIEQELMDAGGTLRAQDLADYRAAWQEPLQLSLPANMTVFCPGLPSGGPVLLYILNILKGYNLSPQDLASRESTILTYHRHLEAFKHAYAVRSRLGSTDGDTEEFAREMDELIQNITSREQGDSIRQQISDEKTFPWQQYRPSFQVQDNSGTSHLSVLGPGGDAVSVTSTINHYFGSKVLGAKTGIIYNNMMDDFSLPGVTNGFGVKPSPSNFIKPGKRPLSSMSPVIVVDGRGVPVLIVGAAGGTKITTTTAFLTSWTLWLGQRMKPAMDSPRPHHQLVPDEAVLSSNSPEWLVQGLRDKGHQVRLLDLLSTPTGILQQQSGSIYADAPGFIVDGY